MENKNKTPVNNNVLILCFFSKTIPKYIPNIQAIVSPILFANELLFLYFLIN